MTLDKCLRQLGFSSIFFLIGVMSLASENDKGPGSSAGSSHCTQMLLPPPLESLKIPNDPFSQRKYFGLFRENFEKLKKTPFLLDIEPLIQIFNNVKTPLVIRRESFELLELVFLNEYFVEVDQSRLFRVFREVAADSKHPLRARAEDAFFQRLSKRVEPELYEFIVNTKVADGNFLRKAAAVFGYNGIEALRENHYNLRNLMTADIKKINIFSFQSQTVLKELREIVLQSELLLFKRKQALEKIGSLALLDQSEVVRAEAISALRYIIERESSLFLIETLCQICEPLLPTADQGFVVDILKNESLSISLRKHALNRLVQSIEGSLSRELRFSDESLFDSTREILIKIAASGELGEASTSKARKLSEEFSSSDFKFVVSQAESMSPRFFQDLNELVEEYITSPKNEKVLEELTHQLRLVENYDLNLPEMLQYENLIQLILGPVGKQKGFDLGVAAKTNVAANNLLITSVKGFLKISKNPNAKSVLGHLLPGLLSAKELPVLVKKLISKIAEDYLKDNSENVSSLLVVAVFKSAWVSQSVQHLALERVELLYKKDLKENGSRVIEDIRGDDPLCAYTIQLIRFVKDTKNDPLVRKKVQTLLEIHGRWKAIYSEWI